MIVLLLLIALPILEIYVIIQVGDAIGVVPTIALLILDSVIGAWLMRSQGRIVWRRFNTAGAVCSIVTGALLSVVLIVLSPTILVDLLHHPAAVFPLRNPAIISMPVSFLAGITASLLTREPEAETRFEDEKLRTYLGIGAE